MLKYRHLCVLDQFIAAMCDKYQHSSVLDQCSEAMSTKLLMPSFVEGKCFSANRPRLGGKLPFVEVLRNMVPSNIFHVISQQSLLNVICFCVNELMSHFD